MLIKRLSAHISFRHLTTLYNYVDSLVPATLSQHREYFPNLRSLLANNQVERTRGVAPSRSQFIALLLQIVSGLVDPIGGCVHLGRGRRHVHQRPPVPHPAPRGAGRRVEPPHQVSELLLWSVSLHSK